MKFLGMKSFVWLVTLTLFLNSFNSFADADELFEQLLTTIRYDSEALAKQGYLSAHGYIEKTSIDYHNEPNVYVNKVFETAFNESGYVIYSRKCKLSNLNHTFGSTYLYYEKSTYNDSGKKTRYAYKSRYLDYCYEYTYNAENRVVTEKSFYNNELDDSIYFTWVNDVLISHTYVDFTNSDYVPHFQFDDQARLVKSNYNSGYSIEYKYQQTDSTLTVQTFIYKADSLVQQKVSIQTHDNLLKYSLMISGSDTLFQLRLTYDRYSNITSLIYDKFPDQSEKEYQSENPDRPIPQKRIFKAFFENNYHQGLMYSRSILLYGYDAPPGVERKYLQRIHYEVIPLAYQSWYVQPKYDPSSDTIQDVEIIYDFPDPPEESDEKKEKKKK